MRKGIGEDLFDFSQKFNLPYVIPKLTDDELKPFTNLKLTSMKIQQDYESPYLPTGFVFKIQILSTWGHMDAFGINNISFFDQLNRNLSILEPKLFCFPNDIGLANLSNILKNSNWEGHYLNKNQCEINSIPPSSLYFVFDKPVSLSKIEITNFTSNTDQTKCIKEFIIYCDDTIIFQVIMI
jgi:hypothetical protein